jgi:hypothetical protein
MGRVRQGSGNRNPTRADHVPSHLRRHLQLGQPSNNSVVRCQETGSITPPPNKTGAMLPQNLVVSLRPLLASSSLSSTRQHPPTPSTRSLHRVA